MALHHLLGVLDYRHYVPQHMAVLFLSCTLEYGMHAGPTAALQESAWPDEDTLNLAACPPDVHLRLRRAGHWAGTSHAGGAVLCNACLTCLVKPVDACRVFFGFIPRRTSGATTPGRSWASRAALVAASLACLCTTAFMDPGFIPRESEDDAELGCVLRSAAPLRGCMRPEHEYGHLNNAVENAS